jgi:hypothetical protein
MSRHSSFNSERDIARYDRLQFVNSMVAAARNR